MTIPASSIVNVLPGVLAAGGNSLVMNGLFLTQNTAMPTGTVLNFASLIAVGNFFGIGSAEYAAAQIYFAGYSNSTLKPGGMQFAPFNLTARSGFLQGGSLAALSLVALKALTGTLTIVAGGVSLTSSAITLTSATSFSNAATIITAAFTSPTFAVTFSSTANAFVVTNTATGATSTAAFATGTIAAGLALTQATGAFLSQGAVLDTPASAVANAVAISQNWASLVTLYEPTVTDKQNYAIALAALNDRYIYLAWDSDVNASVQGNTTCFGFLAIQAAYPCVACFSGDPALAAATSTTLAALALNLAVFAAGAIASINFTQTSGRTTLAFLTSGSIQPTCANQQTAANLLANGYSFYGSYATANQGFIFLYNGQMAGSPFVSIVRYINQVYLNSQFQLALMTLLTTIGSVSYTPSGYGLIRNTLQTPINAGLNFGSIRTNVTLSALQISEVNQAAGVNAATQISSNGFYLQVKDPGPTARQNGQTPIVNFWYTDGGDVLQISMASIDVL